MTYYTDYFAVEDWKVLETMVGYFYNEDATPFEAVCVEIGVLNTFKTNINGTHLEKTPVVRWISRAQYETLKENSGVVIF